MRKIWDAICDFFWEFDIIIVPTAVTAAIIGIGFIIVSFTHNADVKEYNDGNCSCGGHYEYSQAVGHRMSTTYIYTCDECGTPIEIDYIP